KIKVISFDDETVSKLGYHDLSLAEWNFVVHGIAKRKPKEIFVLKAFDFPLGRNYDEKFRDRMQKYDFPIYVTGTATKNVFADRKPVNDKHLIDLKKLHANPARISWIYGQTPRYFYGPAPEIA